MYLTKQKKEAITLTAAMIGTGEQWVGTPLMDGARKELRTALTYLRKVLDHLYKGVDKDQHTAILRFIDTNIIEFVPRPSKGMKKEPALIVAESDMRYLISQCSVECTLCGKTGEEAKRCELRRVLLRSGMMPQGTKDCPFADAF